MVKVGLKGAEVLERLHNRGDIVGKSSISRVREGFLKKTEKGVDSQDED